MRKDEESFTALVERQSRFVYQVAYAVLRNAADSEDVVQETFWKIYRGKAWTRMENERAFLARTAWRIAVGRAGSQKPLHTNTDVISLEIGPEKAAIDADWMASVHRVIDGLPEDLRRPLALSGLEGMSSKEIAALLEIPEGTVRTRLMRARDAVKQRLAGLGKVSRERRS